MLEIAQNPYAFDNTNLRILVKSTGMNAEKVARAIGISESSLKKYEQGDTMPRVEKLIALADYFAVPVDFLLGRYSKAEAAKITANYGRYFMQMRRASYEAYLDGRIKKAPMLNLARVEEPWPYNLVTEINGEPVNYVLTADHDKGIMHALGLLSEKRKDGDRTKDAILMRFRDGLLFDEIGQKLGVSGERARQIVARGLRILKHSSRRGFIVDGYQYTLKRDELHRRRLELKKEEEALDAMEKRLMERRGKIAEFEDKYLKIPEDPEKRRAFYYSVTLEEAEFSVRSYNCLKRSGCNSLADVIRKAELGTLIRVRNLGRKSTEEVLGRIKELTGEDYSEVNEY